MRDSAEMPGLLDTYWNFLSEEDRKVMLSEIEEEYLFWIKLLCR
ncbi:hypothetical protein [Pasteuria penetrans]|nr:hypothetical protein [Pasteuria penetrans]